MRQPIIHSHKAADSVASCIVASKVTNRPTRVSAGVLQLLAYIQPACVPHKRLDNPKEQGSCATWHLPRSPPPALQQRVSAPGGRHWSSEQAEARELVRWDGHSALCNDAGFASGGVDGVPKAVEQAGLGEGHADVAAAGVVRRHGGPHQPVYADLAGLAALGAAVRLQSLRLGLGLHSQGTAVSR